MHNLFGKNPKTFMKVQKTLNSQSSTEQKDLYPMYHNTQLQIIL
jgi:hypothetical protein